MFRLCGINLDSMRSVCIIFSGSDKKILDPSSRVLSLGHACTWEQQRMGIGYSNAWVNTDRGERMQSEREGENTETKKVARQYLQPTDRGVGKQRGRGREYGNRKAVSSLPATHGRYSPKQWLRELPN